MAIIPPQEGDPLVAKINEIIERENASEPVRDYLGASSIGHECSRLLWYKFNGEKEVFNAETIRRFADGHRTEKVVLDWLRQVDGIELYTEANDGGQIGFSLFDGSFRGHYDGIGRGFPQAPKTWHIVEVKCVNEKSFNELKKLKAASEKIAVERWNFSYYTQAQVYMHVENLTRSIHIVATPGARDLVSVRTEYNRDFAVATIEKAKRIISAKEPPERIGGVDNWKCKQCFMHGKCHSGT